MKLTEKDLKLIEAAADLIRKRRERGRSSVGCALITDSGKIYKGINFECESRPCSMCAENAAIGSMISCGEHKIGTIVAVTGDGKIIPPCGRCREMIYDVTRSDKRVWVIVAKDRKVRLKELLCYPWQDAFK